MTKKENFIEQIPQPRERKTLQEMNLTDDFLFDVATEDLENCKTIIELSLGKRLKSLKWREGQKVVHNLPGKRGIRMDFCAEDEDGQIFNVEMQKINTGNIPKRTRFYQALIDAPLLKSGEKGFDNLNPTYIVVICDFDLYEKGKYRYTFANRCEEVPELVMGDECTKVILNTKGKNDAEVERSLVDFLHYVSRSDATCISEECDKRLQDLHEKVQEIKSSTRVEVELMKMEERDRLIREEGEARFVKLSQALLSEKRYEDLERAIEDKEYRDTLYLKYNI